MTTFLVSQRVAGIKQADKILVLGNGELAGQGTHEELMKNCEVYQEIYYSQFPEEKLREIAGDSQAYFNDSAGYYSAEQFFQDSAELPAILFRDDVQEIGLALIYDYDVNLIQWLVLTEA